jgi:hypothetical protein
MDRLRDIKIGRQQARDDIPELLVTTMNRNCRRNSQHGFLSRSKQNVEEHASGYPGMIARIRLVFVAKKETVKSPALKGWPVIARYLGMTPASAQRWAKEGMPVKREGRFVVADPAELEAWIGRESHMGKPAHVMTGEADIAAALKESISVASQKRR